jgi:DNA-binding NarL/FixJ family response regulator
VQDLLYLRGVDAAIVYGDILEFAALSTREFEIFCLVAEGMNAGDIGRRLSLSSKTVANYSTQIKSKLEVNSVAEIARLAIRHGIVDA